MPDQPVSPAALNKASTIRDAFRAWSCKREDVGPLREEIRGLLTMLPDKEDSCKEHLYYELARCLQTTREARDSHRAYLLRMHLMEDSEADFWSMFDSHFNQMLKTCMERHGLAQVLQLV